MNQTEEKYACAQGLAKIGLREERVTLLIVERSLSEDLFLGWDDMLHKEGPMIGKDFWRMYCPEVGCQARMGNSDDGFSLLTPKPSRGESLGDVL